MLQQIEEQPLNGTAPPKTELQELKFKADQVTNESLESTRRMKSYCEESKEAGIRTLVTLDEQGEQLDRIEKDMYKINANMKEAKENLTAMEKYFSICFCPCNKFNESKLDAETWKLSEDGKIVSGQPTRVVDDYNGAGPVTSQYIARITKDPREDEMENNLGQVNTMIGNFRNMAIDIRYEIDSHNHQIPQINKEAESNTNKIKEANESTWRLLK